MSTLDEILTQVKEGTLTIDAAKEEVARFAFESHDIGTHDHLRELRTGIPEVIFAAGKSNADVVDLFRKYSEKSEQLIATRVPVDMQKALRELSNGFYYNETAGIVSIFPPTRSEDENHELAVISAGTSDRNVSEEAAVMARLFDLNVLQIDDVGVAGLSRLTTQLHKLSKTKLIIVVAGMDGALPSVLAGLVRQPVIAVPTSVGYGAAFEGLAALLAMLNSCAPGISIVNIDNGFGAAVMAKKILSNQG